MVETAFSVAMLGGFLWSMRFLLPRALKEHDPLAIASAVVTAALALLTWLLTGVKVVSRSQIVQKLHTGLAAIQMTTANTISVMKVTA